MEPMRFPRMAKVVQEFERQALPDIGSALRSESERLSQAFESMAGRKIAICVGSRGIAKIADIARGVVELCKTKGAKPIIVPAMGSHGGGRAEGQLQILADYGITEASMGVPMISSLEAVQVAVTDDKVPVHVDKVAFDSDGIVLINRVKPHTDFKGKAESGLMKMMAVGLGNIEGASHLHSFTHILGYEHLIISKAEKVLATNKVILGVAILENAYHEIAAIEFVPASMIVKREQELLVKAKAMMPSLPTDELDLLIINQIGKNISGTGLDPNITGRWFGFNSLWQDRPDIGRIVVLDLSPETHGNAVGLGLADLCTQRVIDKLDKKATYINAVTGHLTVPGRIPMHFSTDRDTLHQAFLSLGGWAAPQDKRMMRIRDTLSLTELHASEILLPELRKHPHVVHVGEPRDLVFDAEGALAPMS